MLASHVVVDTKCASIIQGEQRSLHQRLRAGFTTPFRLISYAQMLHRAESGLRILELHILTVCMLLFKHVLRRLQQSSPEACTKSKSKKCP